MCELNFSIEGVEPQRFTAAPTLAFKLRVINGQCAHQVQNVLLQCQIQIDATKRRYTDVEKERLRDLYGEPHRWNETLRSMLWTHASVMVPPFHGTTAVDLPVPCTFDFNVAATKYFHGLEGGEVPLVLLFSGSIFYFDEQEHLRVARISWDKEARYRLLVKVWQDMMDHYYPNTAWLCLRRDAFERLHEFKRAHGIPTWEQTVEVLTANEHALSEATP